MLLKLFPGPLTAPSQQTLEPPPDVAIDLTEDDSGMPKPVVVGPGIEVPVKLANQIWQRSGFPNGGYAAVMIDVNTARLYPWSKLGHRCQRNPDPLSKSGNRATQPLRLSANRPGHE